MRRVAVVAFLFLWNVNESGERTFDRVLQACDEETEEFFFSFPFACASGQNTRGNKVGISY